MSILSIDSYSPLNLPPDFTPTLVTNHQQQLASNCLTSRTDSSQLGSILQAVVSVFTAMDGAFKVVAPNAGLSAWLEAWPARGSCASMSSDEGAGLRAAALTAGGREMGK